jgi:hypothetical protein
MYMRTRSADTQSLQSALPIPASPEETLSFLNLAPNLSSSANISVLAQLLRRRAANLSATPPSSEWLHVRRLWTFLLPIYVSKSNPADKIWDLVERTAQIYLQERGDAPAARRDAAGLIASTVDTVEHTRAARGEARAPWYTGAWSDVADMWVSLGRTVSSSFPTELTHSAWRFGHY